LELENISVLFYPQMLRCFADLTLKLLTLEVAHFYRETAV